MNIDFQDVLFPSRTQSEGSVFIYCTIYNLVLLYNDVHGEWEGK